MGVSVHRGTAGVHFDDARLNGVYFVNPFGQCVVEPKHWSTP